MAPKTLFLAAALAAFAPSAFATDLLLPDPVIETSSPMSPSVYALLYGGYVAGGVVNIDIAPPPGDSDIDAGWGVGGAVGVGVVEGLSVELDVFHTWRHPTAAPPDVTASTTSVMVNAKGTLSLNEMFDIYAGAGIGGIYVYIDDLVTPDSGWGAGYQVMVGSGVNVTENITLFGELRHQNAFSPIAMESSGGGTYNLTLGGVNAALVGVKIGM